MVATPNSASSASTWNQAAPSVAILVSAARPSSKERYPELNSAPSPKRNRRGASSGGNQYHAQPKALKVVGDLRLASTRARRRLGSEMSPDQRRMQRKNDAVEANARRLEMQRKLLIALAKLPTKNQLGLPLNVTGQVPLKALSVLGDNLLDELSRRQIPPGARVTPKVLKFFGSDEPSLIPLKARTLLMGPETLPNPSSYERRHSYPNSLVHAWETALLAFGTSDCRMSVIGAH